MECGVWSVGYGVWGGVWGVGCGVWGVRCGVWGVGCGVRGVGFGSWGLGLRASRLSAVVQTRQTGFGVKRLNVESKLRVWFRV